MAYIVLAGKRDTEQVEAQNKMTLSDADYERVAYWGAKAYFPNGVFVPGTPGQPGQDAIPYQPAIPPTLDDQGNVIDPGQPEVQAQDAVPEVPAVPDSYRQPTGDEIFEAITNAVYAQIKRDVEALFLREAEAEARASVPPIVLTPTAE